MKIESHGKPSPGQEFGFTVIGGAKPIRIVVDIDGVQAWEDECSDPPCHEMFFVPQGARGSQVRIRATDALGNVAEHRFSVKDYSNEPIPVA